jgi:hypothetical protein
MMSPWLFFLSFLVPRRGVTGDSATGLIGVLGAASFGESGSSGGRNPIFLRISSLGDVAISSSRGVIAAGCGGLCFGTALKMVPPGAVRVSATLARFHFFILESDGRRADVGVVLVAADVDADLVALDADAGSLGAAAVRFMLARARLCVDVGDGLSWPFRLKTDRLRLAMLLKLLADRPLDTTSEAMLVGYTAIMFLR